MCVHRPLGAAAGAQQHGEAPLRGAKLLGLGKLDDQLAALVRDAEQGALQILLDALQPLGALLDAGRVIGSSWKGGSRSRLLRRALQECNARLGLAPSTR
jgi:hypothetical protein